MHRHSWKFFDAKMPEQRTTADSIYWTIASVDVCRLIGFRQCREALSFRALNISRPQPPRLFPQRNLMALDQLHCSSVCGSPINLFLFQFSLGKLSLMYFSKQLETFSLDDSCCLGERTKFVRQSEFRISARTHSTRTECELRLNTARGRSWRAHADTVSPSVRAEQFASLSCAFRAADQRGGESVSPASFENDFALFLGFCSPGSLQCINRPKWNK